MDQADLREYLRTPAERSPALDVRELCAKLAASMEPRLQDLTTACQAETGFSEADGLESILGCLQLLRDFRSRKFPPVAVPATPGTDRSLEIHYVPWGTVLAIPPHSAFLYLSLVVMIHALDAGNRVVIRIPSACHGSGRLLQSMLNEAGVATEWVIATDADARSLLQEFYSSPEPGLVHYFGGSARIPDMMSSAFKHGKGLIADGEGNTWVYVDESCDPSEAGRILAEGSTRYGGQTCTSINGAFIHSAIYEEVRAVTIDKMSTMTPIPLTESQLEAVLGSGGTLLSGDAANGPVLLEDVDLDEPLATQGAFAPVLWIVRGNGFDFKRAWQKNAFPLCAGILGQVDFQEWTSLPNAARVVFNGDPSIEDPLEPWGGYPLSGNSPVSRWQEKYLRAIQVDTKVDL